MTPRGRRPRRLAGDPELAETLVALLADPERAGRELEPLSQPGRRRGLALVRLSGEVVFLKRYAAPTGRNWHKRIPGLASAEREWRALDRLSRANVHVPQPRALLALPDGGRLLAMQHLEGRPLRAALACKRAERGALLRDVAARIRELHASGTVHRDLHGENIFITPAGAVLIDLQSARRTRSRAARLGDLAALDSSLRSVLSLPDRVRLRAAAIGATPPFDDEARRAIAAIGEASQDHANVHAKSRTRRARRAGRRYAPLRTDGGALRGLRLRTVPADPIEHALAAHRSLIAQTDASECLSRSERSIVTAVPGETGEWIVKQFPPRGLPRALADAWRGSPALRAWLGGHGLRARRIGAATPIAFLERRRLGLVVESLVVLESLRAGSSADVCPAAFAAPDELLDGLRRLVLALHRRAVSHGDLKASHVWLARGDGGRLTARLIDLEGVRFARQLSDAERMQSLAELNASLPDAIPAAERVRAFRRYATALPFARGTAEALRWIARESVRRDHRWSGRDCPSAGADGRAASPDGRAASPDGRAATQASDEIVTQRK